MADRFDSTKWTGDYPKRAHVSLDSPEGRQVKLRLVRNIMVVIAICIAVGLAIEAFA